MKMDIDALKELAALHAAGALDGDEAKEFSRLLAASADARREAAAFGRVAEALAGSLPTVPPPSALKERIMRQAEQSNAQSRLKAEIQRLLPPSVDGFAFLKEAAGSGWVPLPVAGAFVKLLAFDDTTSYATVLGKLDAGARYPSHRHQCAEDIFMISGDLHIGEAVLRAGDFHHAEAGTTHGVNWSEHGCVLLAVLSKADLVAQFAAA